MHFNNLLIGASIVFGGPPLGWGFDNGAIACNKEIGGTFF